MLMKNWSDSDMEKQKYSAINLSISHFVYHKTILESNLALRGECSATSDPRHDPGLVTFTVSIILEHIIEINMFKFFSSTLCDIQKRHLQEMYLFQALNTPHGFSRQLYEMLTKRRGLSVDGVIIVIQNGQVCQGGTCWGFGDVGCTCS